MSTWLSQEAGLPPRDIPPPVGQMLSMPMLSFMLSTFKRKTSGSPHSSSRGGGRLARESRDQHWLSRVAHVMLAGVSQNGFASLRSQVRLSGSFLRTRQRLVVPSQSFRSRDSKRRHFQ